MKVDSTSLQLKDMPDEVLINIFEFLDAESLKSSRLVTSKWNRIISKSPKLMKQFVLIINHQRRSEFNQIPNFSRCYQEIKFKGMNERNIPKDLVKIVREIGSKVKKVKVSYCEMSSKLEDLIRCIPSTVHVEFRRCSAKEDFKFNPEVFAGCKTLEVSCDQTCLFCVENLQITKLTSWSIRSTDWQDLMNLLAKQICLATLVLEMFETFPPEVELVKMQCPVENLFISVIYEPLSAELLEFMNLFGPSVKSLEVKRNGYPSPPSVTPSAQLDSITSNFKSLTHLAFDVFDLTTQHSNLGFLKPLENVKTMELKNVKFETSKEFKKFFKLFPQLAEVKLNEYVIVSGIRDKFLQCLYKLKNVKKIVIAESNLNEKDFHGDIVVLKNKHLSIKVCNPFDDQPVFDLALKIFKVFGSSKDELMMNQHGDQEAPEWVPVTEEDFEAMNKTNNTLHEIFDSFSAVIHKL